jgi:hypothetical protein
MNNAFHHVMTKNHVERMHIWGVHLDKKYFSLIRQCNVLVI